MKNTVAKTIYTVILIILVVGYYGSANLFYHAHIVNNHIIVHSHPYKKSDKGAPMHSHSGSEFSLIQQLSYYTAEEINTFQSIEKPHVVSLTGIIIFKSNYFIQSKPGCISLRAPPYYLLNNAS